VFSEPNLRQNRCSKTIFYYDKAIRNRWQSGNTGNSEWGIVGKRWQSWGISNWETLGIRNWQSGESSGNLAMRGIIGNQAMEGIRQLGNAGIGESVKGIREYYEV